MELVQIRKSRLGEEPVNKRGPSGQPRFRRLTICRHVPPGAVGAIRLVVCEALYRGAGWGECALAGRTEYEPTNPRSPNDGEEEGGWR